MGQGKLAHWSQRPSGLPLGLRPHLSFLSGLQTAKGLGILLPLPLPPSPQVRLLAKTCPDRLMPGVVGGVMALGAAAIHPTSHTPSSEL